MIMQWFRRFMYGRYGTDSLNRFLSIVSLIFLLLSMVTRWPAFYLLAMLLMLCTLFRSFSRNAWKRGRENQIYLQVKGKATAVFSKVNYRVLLFLGCLLREHGACSLR